MGYTTDFSGEFKLNQSLTDAQRQYLEAFARTRRMKRSAPQAATLPDDFRKAAKLPIGVEGEYFVGTGENFGQDSTPDILNYNCPPATQPGLWCQWTPTEDGTAIVWDGGEKFYNYVEWIEYLIQHFLQPWGYRVNGEVEWSGESGEDLGKIVVTDNAVRVLTGTITYS